MITQRGFGRRQLRALWTSAGCLLALGLLSGCERGATPTSTTRQPSTGKKLAIGFAQVGAESAWRTAESQSIKSEAEKRGVELKFADGQGKQANQIKAVRSFVAQKVDVIVIAPIVETGWEPVLMEAKAAGIPVVLVDRGINVDDDSLYATLIASDFVEEGRMAGAWLAKKTGGKARIVELEGTTGAAPANDRKKGFHEAIAAHPNLVVTKSQSADFTRAKGKEVMEAFLKADPGGIDAVYAHNDDMSLGAIQAIEEAGLKPGVDITLISVDAVKDAFRAMVEGKLNATVECNPLFGPILFDTIDRLRAGETVPKFIKNVDKLYDQSVAAEMIDQREY